MDSSGDLYGEQIAKTSAFYVMLYCWVLLVILDSPVLAWFLLCFLLKTISVLSYAIILNLFLARKLGNFSLFLRIPLLRWRASLSMFPIRLANALML
jgi:hypothetical protein